VQQGLLRGLGVGSTVGLGLGETFLGAEERRRGGGRDLGEAESDHGRRQSARVECLIWAINVMSSFPSTPPGATPSSSSNLAQCRCNSTAYIHSINCSPKQKVRTVNLDTAIPSTPPVRPRLRTSTHNIPHCAHLSRVALHLPKDA
jgi:hypothetical protein